MNDIVKNRCWITVFLFVMAFCVLQSVNADENMRKVTNDHIRIAFHDIPGVQFAGYLMARERGLYRQRGITPVDFIWKNEKLNHFDAVLSGKVEFATGWMPDGVLCHRQKENFVALARMTQKSSCGICVCNNFVPGVLQLKDFNGKKIGIWQNYETTAKVFMARELPNAIAIPQLQESTILLTKGAIAALFYTSYTTEISKNYLFVRDNVRTFRFSDFGLDLPEDTIFSHRPFVESHPELCKNFVLATFEGWQEVVRDPDTAVQLVQHACLEQFGKGDPFILRKQLDEYLKLLALDTKDIPHGSCSEKDFQNMIQALKDARLIDPSRTCPFSSFFIDIVRQKSQKQILK